MKTNKESSIKPFISLILSANIPNLALAIGLITGIITTIAGLVVPILTKNLVDDFSVSSLSVPLIVAIVAAFILQAIIGGISLYLLAAVGQKVVAALRDNIWVRLIRLPVTYFDKTESGEIVSRVINDSYILIDWQVEVSMWWPYD